MTTPLPPFNPENNGAIPPYVPPIGRTPNITPFTYRDGQTYLQILEGLRVYINQVVVPFINTELDGFEQAFADEVNKLIDAVNEAIDTILNSSIEVQDPVVAALIADLDSQTRAALDLVLNGYYTKSEADGLFETKADSLAKANDRYTKAEADALHVTMEEEFADALASVNNSISALATRVAALETLVTTGRLSQSALDDRYLNEFLDGVAIFIGSSNSLPWTLWTTRIAQYYKCVEKNYAIGGAGFTSGVPSNFYTQATTAIADPSIDKSKVRFVFITDTSNDTRFLANVEEQASLVFNLVEENYPNARIIVTPHVLPHTAANMSSDIRRQVSRIYNQLRNVAAFKRRVEVISHSALWFWDGGSWSEGAPVDVHLNPSGYTRLEWFIKQFIDFGIDHANDHDDITGAVAVNDGKIHWRRVSGITHCYGYFTLPADQLSSVKLMQVYAGGFPIDNIPLFVTRKQDGVTVPLSFESTGEVNLQIPVMAGYYYFSTTYQSI